MWVTQKQHKELHQEIYEAISKAKSMSINQYDLQGNFIRIWKSSADIKKELGFQKIALFVAAMADILTKKETNGLM